MIFDSVITRPTYGTQTARVWELADKLSQQFGRKAKRQEVIDAYAREGGNPNTASTQYSQWNKNPFVASPSKLKNPTPLNVVPMRLEIGRDGRVLLPLEFRNAMRLGEGTALTAEVQDGVVTLMSPRTAAIRFQKFVKDTDQGSGSVVDELLAERRAENSKE